MTILTRREYAHLVDTACTTATQPMLECIASYRVICHNLAPLLHEAIAECDDKQHKDHLRDLLKQLQRGES